MTTKVTKVFDPEALARQMRDDSMTALLDLALAVWRGEVTVRYRALDGVGSNDPHQEHFHLSLDLGVAVVSKANATIPDPLAPAAMLDLLEGRGHYSCRRVQQPTEEQPA